MVITIISTDFNDIKDNLLDKIKILYESNDYNTYEMIFYEDSNFLTKPKSKESFIVYVKDENSENISINDFTDVILSNITNDTVNKLSFDYNEFDFIYQHYFNMYESYKFMMYFDFYTDDDLLMIAINWYSTEKIKDLIENIIVFIDINIYDEKFLYSFLKKLNHLISFLEKLGTIDIFLDDSNVNTYLKFDIDKFINFKPFIKNDCIYEMVYYRRPLIEIKNNINSNVIQDKSLIKNLYENNKVVSEYRYDFVSNILKTINEKKF